MNLATFFQNYGLIILLIVLLAFMFWSSRRRTQKQKLEQEQRARQTVPGAEVLLQGGLYGTIVSYDPDNLDQPAIVELAPGVDIKVHSGAILRVVSPTEETVPGDDYLDTEAGGSHPVVEAADDSHASLSDPVDPDAESGTKPQA
jgi:preprotein translocase subunit YajC